MGEPVANKPPLQLDSPIASVAGISPTRARQLLGLNVQTLRDLLDYFPRDYIQESPERDISALKGGEIQSARGQVIAVDFIPGQRPRFVATLSDGHAQLWMTFFYGGYLKGRIVPGLLLRARGKVQFFGGDARMINPKWEVVKPEADLLTDAIYRPIYSATATLPSAAIERLIKQQLEAIAPQRQEWSAPKVLRRRKLMPLPEAYRAIHNPKNEKEALAARRRLVYNEFMLLQIGLGLSKRQSQAPSPAPVFKIDKLLDQRIRDRLSFTLTGAQDRAVWQIVSDLQNSRPMNRLLQGDVGSGKTAVAVYAMLAAVANRLQSALLAPTEVLAEQHFLTLSNMLAGSRVNIGLFTQRTSRGKGKVSQRDLADGQIHIAVGTQALIQERVEFANLGLVVVDEQHRLGVHQRGALRDKAISPHSLVMTATPIPRTLALSYLADFDVSTIDELPPGRQVIQTQWLHPSRAAQAYEFIREEVAKGRQAYIVLPQVEDAGDDVKSVKRELDRLGRDCLSGLRLAALHGRLSTDEKQSVMTSFRDGAIDVLVATTVIEVGIDVPNATIIVIDQAERFGLSQLHQLRGRVGRGSEPSHCILLSDARGSAAEARLSAIARIHSGFEIAEMDLQLRGPGEFFGSRQHGLPQFKLADLKSELHLLAQAKEDAQAILAEDPQLSTAAYRQLRADVVKQFGEALGLAQIG